MAIVTVKGLENSLVQLSQGMIAADGDTPPNTFVTGQGNFEDVHLFSVVFAIKNFPESRLRFRPELTGCISGLYTVFLWLLLLLPSMYGIVFP